VSRVNGEVVYLYAFDVAHEIVIAKAQTILRAAPSSFSIRPDRSLPKDMPLYQPLSIELPLLPHTVQGLPLKIEVRVWQVGVVSVLARVAFGARHLGALTSLHGPLLEDGTPLAAYAQQVCRDVCQSLGDLLIKPALPRVPEAYTVFCVTGIENNGDALSWRDRHVDAIAALLTETDEPEQLAPEQIQGVLKIQVSFEKSDLVVVDWDAALVVDLKGYVDDVLYVLELANLQVEEFRVMDGALDQHLERAYDLVEQHGFDRLGKSRAILQVLRGLRVDFAKLTDEVDHIAKFFGDWYLARVYLGARDRFHLEQWRKSVQNRLDQLDHLHSVVKADIYERRMLWLEATIVILFLIDIVALFLKIAD
jgi:hypothetical protein